MSAEYNDTLTRGFLDIENRYATLRNDIDTSWAISKEKTEEALRKDLVPNAVMGALPTAFYFGSINAIVALGRLIPGPSNFLEIINKVTPFELMPPKGYQVGMAISAFLMGTVFIGSLSNLMGTVVFDSLSKKETVYMKFSLASLVGNLVGFQALAQGDGAIQSTFKASIAGAATQAGLTLASRLMSKLY